MKCLLPLLLIPCMTACTSSVPDLLANCKTPEQKAEFRAAYLRCGIGASIYACQVDAAKLICDGEYQ